MDQQLVRTYSKQKSQRFNLWPMSAIAAVALLITTHNVHSMDISQSNPIAKSSDIILTGKILQGDGPRFYQYVISQFRDKDRLIDGLFVDSIGGNVDEAIYISNIIHNLKFPVSVSDGCKCESACFLLLAAALQRYIGNKAIIGVHSSASENLKSDKSMETMESISRTIRSARLYSEYGIPDSITIKMINTLPSYMYYLDESEKKILRSGEYK